MLPNKTKITPARIKSVLAKIKSPDAAALSAELDQEEMFWNTPQGKQRQAQLKSRVFAELFPAQASANTLLQSVTSLQKRLAKIFGEIYYAMRKRQQLVGQTGFDKLELAQGENWSVEQSGDVLTFRFTAEDEAGEIEADVIEVTVKLFSRDNPSAPPREIKTKAIRRGRLIKGLVQFAITPQEKWEPVGDVEVTWK